MNKLCPCFKIRNFSSRLRDINGKIDKDGRIMSEMRELMTGTKEDATLQRIRSKDVRKKNDGNNHKKEIHQAYCNLQYTILQKKIGESSPHILHSTLGCGGHIYIDKSSCRR
jgi:hypothetical protein